MEKKSHQSEQEAQRRDENNRMIQKQNRYTNTKQATKLKTDLSENKPEQCWQCQNIKCSDNAKQFGRMNRYTYRTGHQPQKIPDLR